jgi:hypothetical protein
MGRHRVIHGLTGVVHDEQAPPSPPRSLGQGLVERRRRDLAGATG